jgi:hypothetical protein
VREGPDRLPVAAGLDTATVVLFVAAGRRTHDQDPGIAGLVETAAPFVIALVIGWLVARAWRNPGGLWTGIVIWVVTVVLGMVLRQYVFDRGTAPSFIVVASLFLGAGLVGWRLLLAGFDAWRARRARVLE